MSLGGLESVNQDASSAPNRNAGNFIQTEINPGVAYDKTTKKCDNLAQDFFLNRAFA